MTQEATEAIGNIRALCKRSISVGEFNYDHNEELEKYCKVLSGTSNLDAWMPSLFELIEEFDDEVDLTLGSPGPLVHTMEATTPDYQKYLITSLESKPTGIAVWMAKRITRSAKVDKDSWQRIIKDVKKHPQATRAAREMVEDL